MSCPLCLSQQTKEFVRVSGNRGKLLYHLCEVCDLRYMDAQCRMSSSDEKKRYESHNNDVESEEYQQFVMPLVEEVKKYFPEPFGKKGLDFGSGTGPVLKKLLQHRGYSTDIYDPFFAPHSEVFERQYHFICSSEVVEHFCDPHKEFKSLRAMLKPGGILSVMTLFYEPSIDFTHWHYRRDETHVVFYSSKTLSHIAKAFGFSSYTVISQRLVTFFT